MTPASIEGETELTHADFWEAFPAVPQFRQSSRIWMVVPLMALFAFMSGTVDRTVWISALPMLGFVGLSFGFRWYVRRIWAKRAVTDYGAGPTRFRFDEAGLTVTSKLRRLELSWPSLPQHIETPASLIVYTSSQALLVIPKRAFAASDLDALRSLLQQRIPTKPAKGRLPQLLVVWAVVLVAFLSIWHFLNQSP